MTSRQYQKHVTFYLKELGAGSEISSILLLLSKYLQLPELGASSGCPMWLLPGPKDLSHSAVISQAMLRELDQTWSRQDLNCYLYGMPASQAEQLGMASSNLHQQTSKNDNTLRS